MEGEPYELMSYDFVGNVYHKPVVWYPELHFNIDNKTQLTVVVNMSDNSVIYSRTNEMLKLGTSSSTTTQNQTEQLSLGVGNITKEHLLRNQSREQSDQTFLVLIIGMPILGTAIIASFLIRKRK